MVCCTVISLLTINCRTLICYYTVKELLTINSSCRQQIHTSTNIDSHLHQASLSRPTRAWFTVEFHRLRLISPSSFFFFFSWFKLPEYFLFNLPEFLLCPVCPVDAEFTFPSLHGQSKSRLCSFLSGCFSHALLIQFSPINKISANVQRSIEEQFRKDEIQII